MSVIIRVVSLVIFFLCLTQPVHASLLYPSVQDVSIDPGESAEILITLQNSNEDSRAYAIDFIGVDLGLEEGEYSFFDLDPGVEEWFSSELQEFELMPGEVREFGIVISPDIATKSQTMVVGIRIVESVTGQLEPSVQSGFISLAFLTIGDDISESVEWLGYQADRSFSFGNAQTFYTVRNSGDRFVQPNGIVSLISWTGGVVDVFDINPESKRIANNQERTFVVDIYNNWALGPYELRFDAEPWDGGEVHSDSVVVWFVSVKTLGLILGCLIILFIIWRYAKRR